MGPGSHSTSTERRGLEGGDKCHRGWGGETGWIEENRKGSEDPLRALTSLHSLRKTSAFRRGRRSVEIRSHTI